MEKIIGPFTQILTMDNLPPRGALSDDSMEVLEGHGILLRDGSIAQVAPLDTLKKQHPDTVVQAIKEDAVLLPGFIDTHTHLCWAGNRAQDFAMRLNGSSYLEIAEAGGGIWSTVVNTRAADTDELIAKIAERADQMLQNGVTTVEVKTGYGLHPKEELRMLRAIRTAALKTKATLIPTCLAAHMKPHDFDGTNEEYLQLLKEELLPAIKSQKLTARMDIFIEETAFSPEEARDFLTYASSAGFRLTVHGDQFTTGGSEVAVDLDAVSVDHLEASGPDEIRRIANSITAATILPGASIGLGMPFAPARKLLDAGAALVIASDWNPGSAPMGQLLTQAAILAAYERLSTTEVLAALTVRAAAVLDTYDRGRIARGMRADLQAYPTDDYRHILYHQGSLRPHMMWAGGQKI